MHHPYNEALTLIERVHRHFLEVVKVDLDRQNIQDINNVQALILYNLDRDEMTVGELTARGYYLGSNVSYNVKKMVENGYLLQERSPHDRRSVRVKLSEKGCALRDKMAEAFAQQVQMLGASSITEEELLQSNATLDKLERFWQSIINYGRIG